MGRLMGTRLILLLLAGLLAGCGATSQQAPTPTGTPAPIPCGASCGPVTPGEPLDATEIVATMRYNGLPIGIVETVNPSNDPNQLPGQPGRSVSKAAFTDQRLPAPTNPSQLAVSDGGSLEAFDSEAAAQQQAQFIAGLAQASSPIAEYDYLSGKTLLRVSHGLAPDQAQQYAAALARVTNAPALPVIATSATPTR